MTRTDSVHAVFLEFLEAVHAEFVGHSDAHAGVILMEVDAAQLHATAIEHEAAVGAECDMAEAGGDAHGVDSCPGFVAEHEPDIGKFGILNVPQRQIAGPGHGATQRFAVLGLYVAAQGQRVGAVGHRNDKL